MLPAPFHLIEKRACRSFSLEKGKSAFLQDEKTRGLFFLLEGQIELHRVTKSGDNIIIHRAKSGETFAEASLFSEKYHCDAIATSKCKVIEVNRSDILDRFQSDTKFAIALARRFSVQTQEYRRKIEILAIRSAEQRIIAAIDENMLGDSIKDFAADINLSHEAVYRGLGQLVKKGLLVKSARGQFFKAA